MNAGEIIVLLREKVGELLATPLTEEQDDTSFIELGVDSVVGTEIIEFIRRKIAPSASVSILFDHASIAKLTGHLSGDQGRARSPSVPSDGFEGVRTPPDAARTARSASAPHQPRQEDRVAVVGMSGRFAGADTPDELWRNLAAGVCSVTEIPANRSRYWDLDGLAKAKGALCRWGGFLADVESFAAGFFGISPKEAAFMDPQQRIFLEEAWRAMEDAGFADGALADRRCGTFVGVMNTDYQDLLTRANANAPEAHELMGNAGSILAARVAYHLNLRGAAVAVDTACSASLVAIHLACRALAQGELDVALAGGVTLYLTQKRYSLMEQAGMVTRTGACRPFDDAADGFVPGEGCGVVVLKRLADAVAAGDSIHGVILASGMNQAGKTNGITAPSMRAQFELLADVHRQADVDPGTIQYVETHGTGTVLGDPIEAEALSKALRLSSRTGQFCRLGSLKANLGHTSAAAGVAGLIKVLLAMKHRAIPPQIHFQKPNHHIPFGGAPFRINTVLEPWEREGEVPRRAAISSFGFSGANAHLVVEEAPTAAVPHPTRTHVAFERERFWYDLLKTEETSPSGASVEPKPQIRLKQLAPTQTAPAPQVEPALPPELSGDVVKRVRALVARVLYLDESRVSDTKKFADLGMDSILAVELSKKIRETFGVNLPAARLYDHPSVRELAEFVSAQDPNVGRVAPRGVAHGRDRSPGGSGDVVHEPSPHGAFGERALPQTPNQDRRVVVGRSGDISEIQFATEASDDPVAGEVQVAIEAATVMLADLLCVRGLYPTMPSYPFTPGFEIAGVVTRVGTGVTEFQAGDRVYGLTGEKLGGHADTVNVDARLIAPMPSSLDFAEACTLPVAFLTARHALLDVGRLAAGETLLIHSAASGTGLMAIQLAKRAGARIFATVGSDAKLAPVQESGVSGVWNYRKEGVMEALHRGLPDGHVDVVLNMVSGAVRDQSLSLLAPSGRFLDLAVGGLKASAPVDLSALVDNQGYFGIDARRLSRRDPLAVGRRLRELSALLGRGEVQPLPVNREFPLSEARAAYEWLSSREGFGRVILRATGKRSLPVARVLRTETPRSSKFEPVAIIGMSGRFPGARDLETFWRNLAAGVVSISEVPSSRWPLAGFYDPDPANPRTSASKWGGFVDGVDEFDASFFQIARAEAEPMDPQHRLFLQEAWKAIEDAGYARRELAGGNHGVFVGIGSAEYHAGVAEPDAHGLLGNLASGLAGRAAYLLDWTGPCLAVDSACSSSFSAIHLACQSLANRECDVALAGGVHLATTPRVFLAVSRMGLLSPTGACRAFDAAADGWAIGEGVGAVLLKRLEDAERDGDSIHAVIRGCGINQDGSKNGFSAPKAATQAALQRRVHALAGIDPATVDYVEAHGMSTPLGDEIEMLALRESFAAGSRRVESCALGTLKPNIGHPIAAAGMACLFKVVLALRHRQLPPMVGPVKVNEALGLEGGPFSMNTTLREWKPTADHPRRAAINGFGATGTNGHLILEEHRSVRGAEQTKTGPSVVVLSARDGVRLRESAANLAAFLREHSHLRLVDVAFTLQVGREGMEERLAFVATSLGDAVAKLDAFLGAERAGGICRGRVENSGGTVVHGASLEEMARRWVEGADVDWKRAEDGKGARRISLPTYPFARERYWHSAPKSGSGPEAASSENEGVEVVLQTVIGDVLRCDPVTIDPDRELARYGFDSLYVLQVVNRFETATGFRLAPRLFFEARTIRELARRVPALRRTEPVVSAAQGSGTFPLSEGQQALWSIQQTNPETRVYHLPVALEWEGPLDLKVLEPALRAIVDEQPCLRTIFPSQDGGPVQRVLETSEVKLREEIFGGRNAGEILVRLRELANRPFDLETGPLWRAHVLSVNGSRRILLLVFHHLIFDGFSLGLFLEKLERRVRDGGGAASRRKVSGFENFVEAERRYLSSESCERDRDYWLGRFPKGFATSGLARDGSGRAEGALHHVTISREEVLALEKLARDGSVTLQSVFLAAFQALLAVASGRTEVMVGVAADVRATAGDEELMGYFVNLLPIGAEISRGELFCDVLRRTFGRLLDAFEHRRFPFRQLARALAARHEDPSRHELRTAFYFQTWSTPERSRFAERMVRDIHQAGEFDLVFEVMEGAGDWRLNVKYRPGVFSAVAMERLASRYLALLRKLSGGFSQEIGKLTGEEPRRVEMVGGRGFAYPQVCVHELIEAQAKRTPGAVAAIFQGQRWNYGELDARAERMARQLVQAGVRPGSLVGVLLNRSLDMLAGLVAVWKVGAAYVPLDPNYPVERIRSILADSQAATLLTHSEIGFQAGAMKVVLVDAGALADGASLAARPRAAVGVMDSLAYVIYTSGSTGQPKGVSVTHRSLAHFLCCMRDRPGCSADDHILALTTICFDIAALELFLPLVCGGRVEILPEETTRDGIRLKEAVERSGATIIQATPATWKMLLAAKLGALPNVRILCGGEAWNGDLSGPLLSRAKEVWNMYGPTETTVWSSIQKVEPGKPVHLGEPIGNTRFYVLDEDLKPVPTGEIGELYIGGDGLARGYWNRPDLTRERFIRHPREADEIIYRTGDLVRHA